MGVETEHTMSNRHIITRRISEWPILFTSEKKADDDTRPVRWCAGAQEERCTGLFSGRRGSWHRVRAYMCGETFVCDDAGASVRR